MKKLSLALLFAALSACTIKLEVDENNKPVSIAGDVGTTGHALSEGLLEIQKLSKGVTGLVPDMGSNGGVSMSSAMRMAPGLQRAPGDVCDSVFPETTVTIAKTDYPAAAEEKSADITLTLTCWQIGSPATVSTVSAVIMYKDDSTGTTAAAEATGATDVVDGNLMTDYIVLDVARYFTEEDERVSFHFTLETDLGGDFDHPTRTRYYRHATFVAKMRNGAQVTTNVTPDEPIADGADFTVGTVTRETVHAKGELATSSESATVTGKDTGTYTIVNVYKDGTKDEFTITSDGQKITVDAKGHNGFTRKGTLDLISGEFDITTTFPAGMVIASVTEKGTWQKDATTGDYERTVNFSNGDKNVTKADITVNTGVISATFTHSETRGAATVTVTGDITLTHSSSATTIVLNITNESGDKANLTGTRFADGTSTLEYTKDLKSTSANPDESGAFSFAADGSGTGKVTQKNGSAEVVYDVTVNADGTGTVQDSTGKVVHTF